MLAPSRDHIPVDEKNSFNSRLLTLKSRFDLSGNEEWKGLGVPAQRKNRLQTHSTLHLHQREGSAGAPHVAGLFRHEVHSRTRRGPQRERGAECGGRGGGPVSRASACARRRPGEAFKPRSDRMAVFRSVTQGCWAVESGGEWRVNNRRPLIGLG